MEPSSTTTTSKLGACSRSSRDDARDRRGLVIGGDDGEMARHDTDETALDCASFGRSGYRGLATLRRYAQPAGDPLRATSRRRRALIGPVRSAAASAAALARAPARDRASSSSPALLLAPCSPSRGLAEKQPRRSGTNSVFPGSVVAELKRGQHLCQAAIVPARHAGDRDPVRPRGVPARHDAAAARREPEGDRHRAADRRSGRAPRASSSRARSTTTWAATSASSRASGRPRGSSAATEKPGMTINDLIVAGAISMAYYRPGEERLISMVPVVAQRIGRTRGMLGGAWRAVAVVVLLLASVGLAACGMRGLLRGRRRRIALIVALVAGLNTLAWGLLVPAIQVPDEHFHLSYVQDLAEHRKPPAAYVDQLSEELNVIVGGAAVGDINFNPVGRGRWSPDAEAEARPRAGREAEHRQPGREHQPARLSARLLRDARAGLLDGPRGGRLDARRADLHARPGRAAGDRHRAGAARAAARAVPEPPAADGRRGAGLRLPARVHVDLRRGEPGRDADRARRGAVLAVRPRLPARARRPRGDRDRPRAGALGADEDLRARLPPRDRARRRPAAVAARAARWPVAAGAGGRARGRRARARLHDREPGGVGALDHPRRARRGGPRRRTATRPTRPRASSPTCGSTCSRRQGR